LEKELAGAEPWRLESNPFEQARYAAMLEIIKSARPYSNALEVGCAAGTFTERLAPLCERLCVVDLLPEAVERGALRLVGQTHITWQVDDIVTFAAPDGCFDLVVAAEVLYYLDGGRRLAQAIRNLTRLLAPDGMLVFSSARDDPCASWGLKGGAETCMRALSQSLRETRRRHCKGAFPDEDCLIVGYVH
jgi:2-polyprenyl-3-methyl-5-hydroxy-6-metoxy-1,4-benzoquinol methylase